VLLERAHCLFGRHLTANKNALNLRLTICAVAICLAASVGSGLPAPDTILLLDPLGPAGHPCHMPFGVPPTTSTSRANPLAIGTSVNYELAQYGPVEITVHDVSGRLVRRLESGPHQRGIHVARWDGTDNRGRAVPDGVYFVRLSAGGKVLTGRPTLVR